MPGKEGLQSGKAPPTHDGHGLHPSLTSVDVGSSRRLPLAGSWPMARGGKTSRGKHALLLHAARFDSPNRSCILMDPVE